MHGNPQTPGFEESPDGGGGESLAQRGDDTAGNKNKLGLHGDSFGSTETCPNAEAGRIKIEILHIGVAKENPNFTP
ncbi:hypothetical protein JCM30471_10950 [Desulfuromonas carbonis]